MGFCIIGEYMNLIHLPNGEGGSYPSANSIASSVFIAEYN